MLKILSFLFVIIVIFLIASATNGIISLLFSTFEDTEKQKRLKQLKNVKTNKEAQFGEIMNIISDTTNKSILPRLKRLFPGIVKSDYAQIDKELKLIGWDDTFTAESFVGAVWGLRCLALPVAIFAFTRKTPLNVILLFVAWALAFGLEYMAKSEKKTMNDELFSEFPEFIRITSGFLSADIPLVKSITDSIKYVGAAWEPILKTFVIDCDNKSVDFALTRMKDNVDLFEVKEFVSLIRLTLEQGGNAKEGFLSQADKIAELQKDQFILKVGKRKMYGQIVQMPLLLLNTAILGLPTIYDTLGMLSGGMKLG